MFVTSSVVTQFKAFLAILFQLNMVDDYAACLELRSEGCQVIENSSDDLSVLIMQLLIDNISPPAPNITHFLLRFDLDFPLERTVILNTLEMLPKLDINSMLHEFGFQLLYELCLDPLTSGPTIDLLKVQKISIFSKAFG